MTTISERINILGVELEWKLRSGDTGGQYCVLAATVPPGVGIPLHQHPEQEAFLVLDGHPEFAVEENGTIEWRTAKPRDVVNIPPDTMHAFRNSGDYDVHVIITCVPRLGEFFEQAGTPVEDTQAQIEPTLDEIHRVLAVAARFGQRFAPPEQVPLPSESLG